MMVNIIHNPQASIRIRGRSISERGVSVALESVQTTDAAAESEFELDDFVWGDFVGAEVLTEGRIVVATECGCTPVFWSLDEAIATVDELGYVQRVSNGVARIRARVRGIVYQFNVPVSLVGGQSFQLRLRYRDGSAGQAITGFMDAAYAGATLGQRAWLSGGTAGVWNPNCWAIAAGVKIWPTIIYTTAHHSDSNPTRGQQGGGTFVHPNFAICTAHFASAIGSTVTCKAADGTNHLRTVTDRFAASNVSFGDWQILYFEEPMPETIGFARVLPVDWRDYFPSVYGPQIAIGMTERVVGIPTIRRTRQNLTSVSDWYVDRNYISPPGDPIHMVQAFSTASGNADRDQFMRLEDFDAGNSSTGCSLVNPATGDLIFLGPIGGAWGGPSMDFRRADTEAWMDSKLPGAALTDADLSAYANYGD